MREIWTNNEKENYKDFPSVDYMWQKAESRGQPVRIKLTTSETSCLTITLLRGAPVYENYKGVRKNWGKERENLKKERERVLGRLKTKIGVNIYISAEGNNIEREIDKQNKEKNPGSGK